ncbi:putrescine hydroxycinnamoyltransferase 1-like [Triticum dicoccoides]|uniref:putrescine hydroxycinnamoyltransferase 1-like n=1 Tax=Triticum dicoccoides TaxID=85692 RepID=UPI00188E5F46|nr:putrescine hydroxycinnamoyltransferase 1-like [Triticum dicoccoides]
MDSGSSVRVVESCLVTPSDDTPREGLWLSALDLVLANRGHTPLVHFYSTAGAGSDVADDFFDVARLKESMARALVPFYPLAGRLGVDSGGRTEVNCNAEGALFVVARSDHTLEDFVDPTPSPELRMLFGPRVHPSSIVLAVQVTFLRCGGVVLGTAVHHAVVDGASTFQFLRTWASYCRDGESAAVDAPCHHRALLRGRSPRVIHPETIPMFCNELIMHEQEPSPAGTMSSTVVTRILTVSRDQLHALKRLCGGASTFCAVTALVWRCVCVARPGLHPDSTTRINFPVDIRRRLTPPLPDRYFGNGVVNVFTTAAVKDVVSQTLASVAGRVKAAADRVDDELLRSAVDYFEETASAAKQGVRRRAEDRGNLPETELRMNSWFRIPVHDADFGWGQPRAMTRAEAVRGGWVYLLAARADGSARVLISLEAATHHKFQHAAADVCQLLLATERPKL